MKKQILFVLFTIYTVCSNAQMAINHTDETLKIDTSKSEIKWTGEYAFYFGGHDGTISFKKGYFIKNKNVIIGGEFIIDMHSILNTDIKEEEANEDLVNHLKNEDFFDVKKFPTAKLIFTSVSYHNTTTMKIYANLTIKDVTLPINFRAEVDYELKQMTTKFKIDRTLWNIKYNSKEIEGNLKDGLISDAIGFEVTLAL
ncbi:YceI family protein [Winogradskyella thalassocola]|uniref:Polyisoprenoid-binding protein YceI n=1 Tax=Winogradskyella thalassocola TaxID=262004 RepID=A0A1G7W842_9FLAO|nr:YceI family protein [Winogradskyella thalassocola]SDG68117.1 Polyisoprenoid-binding protein YceI [Winogradskyella thalassocola]